MLQRLVKFVGEFIPWAAASRAFRVAALNHEPGNHTMKDGAIVEWLPGLGTLGQRDEILHGFRHLVRKQFNFELAFSGVEYSIHVVWHHCDCNSSSAFLLPESYRLMRGGLVSIRVLHGLKFHRLKLGL